MIKIIFGLQDICQMYKKYIYDELDFEKSIETEAKTTKAIKQKTLKQ